MRIIDADAFVKKLRIEQETTEIFFGAVEPDLVDVCKKLMESVIGKIEREPTITDCSVCPLKRP